MGQEISTKNHYDGELPYRDSLLLALPSLYLISAALLFDNKWITTGALILGGTCYFGLVAWKDPLFRTFLSTTPRSTKPDPILCTDRYLEAEACEEAVWLSDVRLKQLYAPNALPQN